MDKAAGMSNKKRTFLILGLIGLILIVIPIIDFSDYLGLIGPAIFIVGWIGIILYDWLIVSNKPIVIQKEKVFQNIIMIIMIIFFLLGYILITS